MVAKRAEADDNKTLAAFSIAEFLLDSKGIPMGLSSRDDLSRRDLLAGAGLAFGMACMAASPVRAQAAPAPVWPFRFCLNTGTIRGFNMPVPEQVKLAAETGYSGIELWMDNVYQYMETGGTLPDLHKQIVDAGLTVEDAISFPSWMVDDDTQRAKGMETMQRDMDTLAQLGAKRIAAPPAGAHQAPRVDLARVADRYRAVLELGQRMGVVPQLEIWGASTNLGRLEDAIYVAVGAGHPDACLLLDIFHLFRGGSDFGSLRLLNGAAMNVFHMNDYPANPPREQMNDSHRVFPGDGVAPLEEILRTLHATGFRGVLSLELFNRDYWKQDPVHVARTGLEKMKACVAKTGLG